MSADEIAAVRSSFLPSIDHFGAQQGLVREADETAITFRFRLEEMWMDAQGMRIGRVCGPMGMWGKTPYPPMARWVRISAMGKGFFPAYP